MHCKDRETHVPHQTALCRWSSSPRPRWLRIWLMQYLDILSLHGQTGLHSGGHMPMDEHENRVYISCDQSDAWTLPDVASRMTHPWPSSCMYLESPLRLFVQIYSHIHQHQIHIHIRLCTQVCHGLLHLWDGHDFGTCSRYGDSLWYIPGAGVRKGQHVL